MVAVGWLSKGILYLPRKHDSTKTSNVYDILLVLQGDIFNREAREVRET
jgi:hypothetical protein